jgi:hypothetical protein
LLGNLGAPRSCDVPVALAPPGLSHCGAYLTRSRLFRVRPPIAGASQSRPDRVRRQHSAIGASSYTARFSGTSPRRSRSMFRATASAMSLNFLAVVETLHFGGAAQIGLAQPNLSQQIKKIEKILRYFVVVVANEAGQTLLSFESRKIRISKANCVRYG